MNVVKYVMLALIAILITIQFLLVMQKLVSLEDKIDCANEMLVQLRTNGIIGERVK